jgi:ribosomal protein L40E
MLLKLCGRCAGRVSDKALACPRCGYPRAGLLRAQRLVAIVLLIVAVTGMLALAIYIAYAD